MENGSQHLRKLKTELPHKPSTLPVEIQQSEVKPQTTQTPVQRTRSGQRYGTRPHGILLGNEDGQVQMDCCSRWLAWGDVKAQPQSTVPHLRTVLRKLRDSQRVITQKLHDR